MKTLLMTVGLPRSGKSTWAKEQGVPIVAPDAIRLALHGQAWAALAEGFVWAIAQVMVRALFISGHDTVILDSTANTHHRRIFWKSNSWVRKYHIIDTPKDVCISRAKETEQDYLLPIIEKMDSEREEITTEDVD